MTTSLARVCLLIAASGAVAQLRFRVGDRVSCHLGNARWEPGTVRDLHVKNAGQTAVYLVQLDSGGVT